MQRIGGRASGLVNGQRFQGIFVDLIAITSSGRVDMIVRNPPPSLAASFQLLTPFSEAMGWIFGIPSSNGTRNGYEVTGGKFVRNATVIFESGDTIALHILYSQGANAQ